MAISLSSLKQKGARQATASRLAKEADKQQKRESKRSGWSKFLGGVGGKLLGTALAGMTGGLAAPLLMAAGTFGGKKIAHDLTKGMGADTSKLTAGKYGYGGAEATTLREGLEQQLRESDPMKQRGAFGGELLGAYASAGFEGDMFGKAETFGKDVKEFGIGDTMARTFGVGGEEFGKGVTEQGLIDNPWLSGEADDMWDLGESSDLLSGIGGQTPLSPSPEFSYQQGGMVQDKAPSIVDYFSMQGKTLGGSNTQSLSQMLGR